MYVRAQEFRDSLIPNITGEVLEIGPGQIAFPTPFAKNLILVDKLPSELHKQLFPELGQDISIVEPDYLVDLDSEKLKIFSDETFDCVVASHMLEHLAQPFRMLDEIYRVLKPGASVIIFLPDRRRTFDKSRICQSFEHFAQEYLLGNDEVSDYDLDDYLTEVENYKFSNRDEEFVQLHLARSIHVHAWTDEEFVHLLEQMTSIAQFRFKIIKAISSSRHTNLEEFGLVLEKNLESAHINISLDWEKSIVNEVEKYDFKLRNTKSSLVKTLKKLLPVRFKILVKKLWNRELTT